MVQWLWLSLILFFVEFESWNPKFQLWLSTFDLKCFGPLPRKSIFSARILESTIGSNPLVFGHIFNLRAVDFHDLNLTFASPTILVWAHWSGTTAMVPNKYLCFAVVVVLRSPFVGHPAATAGGHTYAEKKQRAQLCIILQRNFAKHNYVNFSRRAAVHHGVPGALWAHDWDNSTYQFLDVAGFGRVVRQRKRSEKMIVI